MRPAICLFPLLPPAILANFSGFLTLVMESTQLPLLFLLGLCLCSLCSFCLLHPSSLCHLRPARPQGLSYVAFFWGRVTHLLLLVIPTGTLFVDWGKNQHIFLFSVSLVPTRCPVMALTRKCETLQKYVDVLPPVTWGRSKNLGMRLMFANRFFQTS